VGEKKAMSQRFTGAGERRNLPVTELKKAMGGLFWRAGEGVRKGRN
jgi:hypothetical protein